MLIKAYTDGSCHAELKLGAWAAIILEETTKETLLSDTVPSTTNNRMELTAAIQAIQYIQANHGQTAKILLHTDSQYLCRLPIRAPKLKTTDFLNKQGKALPNQDLIRSFINLFEVGNIELIKLRAHGKKELADPYHRRADMLSRKILRAAVQKMKNRN